MSINDAIMVGVDIMSMEDCKQIDEPLHGMISYFVFIIFLTS